MVESLQAESEDSPVKQVHSVLELLGTGIYCNTFSERGRKQNAEVQRFKEAVCVLENKAAFRRFCEDLLRDIASCIICTQKSVDT